MPSLQTLDLIGSKAIPAAALHELRLALPKADMRFPDGTNPPKN
jgi:hypothetical protein